MSEKLLFIVLDAFRHDYINEIDTPFLFAKTREGVYAEKLKSSSGFTQRTAIFTGTSGLESGMFTMHTFDAENSPFAFLRNDRRIGKVPKIKRWWDDWPDEGLARFPKEILTRYHSLRRGQKLAWITRRAKEHADNAPAAHIPLALLPEIGVSEDNRPIHLPKAFDQESIFDVFVEQDVPYAYTMYPLVGYRDQEVLDAILEQEATEARVILAQFTESDGSVHLCGPGSPARRGITGEIDRKLRQIAERFDDDTRWILIGDHGMTDVTEEIDVAGLLGPLERENRVRMGRDYLLFLDSTMARLKWVTEAGKRFLHQVTELAELRAKGKFVDDEVRRQVSIPMEDRRYGDLIWLADVGVLIFPDYFHDLNTHNKGMHGYDSNHDDMKGFFLAFGPGIESRYLEEAHLVDVCSTICRAAGVRAPRDNQGECLL